MTRDLLNPSPLTRLRHAAHLRWNNSRLNPEHEVWACSCTCCCLLCEEPQMLSSLWRALTGMVVH